MHNVKIPLQVNGDSRDFLQVIPDITETEIRELALARAKIREQLWKMEIVKVVYVPGRYLNIILK